jgi:hypothetical protein
MSDPFDSGSRPLQLRRGSDANKRKSLIEKYGEGLNQTSDDVSGDQMTYNRGEETTGGGAPAQNNSMTRLESELKGSRNKKIKYGIIAGVVFIVIVGIILIVTLSGKGKDPPNPPTPPPGPKIFDKIYNPYKIADITEEGSM